MEYAHVACTSCCLYNNNDAVLIMSVKGAIARLMLMIVDIGSNDNTICSPVAPTVGFGREQSSKLTARQQTIAELFQTEKNYVGILHTILKVLSLC